MSDRILRAYYDLAVSPVSFDVCVFLYVAEMERLHRGLDAIDFLVVASHGNGFRHDLASYKPLSELMWRLHHIVLPAHRLVPACRRAVYYPNREEALRDFDPSNPNFPTGHTLDWPNPKFLDSDILTALYVGKPLATLRAPDGAVQKVGEWLNFRSGGRKTVTITLRAEALHPGRNSRFDQWIRFAHALDPAIYQPVFVRDTADISKPLAPELKNFPVFDPAALDIELRLALYELAYINLFVDSGPATLCMLDDHTRCIRFALSMTSNPHSGLLSFYRRGYSDGMQWVNANTHQISVWEDDTSECIMREFKALEEQLKSGMAPARRSLPPINLVAANLLVGRNYADAITLTTLAVSRDPDNLEAQYILANSLMNSREYLAAAKEFEQLFHRPETQEIVLIPFVTCLWAIGRPKAAIELLINTAQQRLNNPSLLKSIAQTLFEFGEEAAGLKLLSRLMQEWSNDASLLSLHAKYLRDDALTIPEAIEAIGKALQLQPDNPDLHTQLAHCFAALADYKDAIRHLEKAITLKGESSIKDWVQIGQWRQHIGDAEKAQATLLKAGAAVDEHLDCNINTAGSSIEWLASKAQINLLLGSKPDAHACYAEILNRYGSGPLFKSDNVYQANTPGRLERFRKIVEQRDVFIFCNGPSIAAMDSHWRSFAATNPYLMAANAFDLYEAGFLAQTQTAIDAAIVTNHKTFQRMINKIVGFLSRGSQNLLVTLGPTIGRLGMDCPTRQELEARFDEKLLYLDRINETMPATPYYPLSFLSSDPLSCLILLATIGRARRIFVFGADGTVQLDPRQTGYYGFDRDSFRTNVTDEQVTTLRKVRIANAMSFNHATEMGFIAFKHLFGVEPPPIYNVSPDSTIDTFPRIGYDEALELLDARRPPEAALRARNA